MNISESIDRRRWYAVHSKPKQELRADSNLRYWGVETLMPKRSDPPWDRLSRITDRVRPLFPGYLFARFDADALLSKVRLTRGVHSVVGFGEQGTPIDDAIITFIRGRLQEDGFVRIKEPRPGDVVTIINGPLRSLTGIFERELRDQDRVVILLTVINAQAHVNVAKADVRRAYPESQPSTP